MTSLGSRQRVRKDSLRVDAYGTVDELNTVLGVALAHGLSQPVADAVKAIQNELFHLGAELSYVAEAGSKQRPVPQIEQRHVDRLETLIDEMTAVVGPLENFTLPGGSIGAANLHVARTVCRRAERIVVSLSREEPVNALALKYLNRLSDALFALARFENHQAGVAEPLWDSRS